MCTFGWMFVCLGLCSLKVIFDSKLILSFLLFPRMQSVLGTLDVTSSEIPSVHVNHSPPQKTFAGPPVHGRTVAVIVGIHGRDVQWNHSVAEFLLDGWKCVEVWQGIFKMGLRRYQVVSDNFRIHWKVSTIDTVYTYYIYVCVAWLEL